MVTAEALDLVLYPNFQFSEEARPIVAREVAKRATVGRAISAIVSGAAWPSSCCWAKCLLPVRPADGDLPDERRFRQEVVRALAHTWTEDADAGLRHAQAAVDRYTSPAFWQEHPKRHALLQTGLGLLRLVVRQLDRGLQANQWHDSGTDGTGSRKGRVPVGVDDGG